VVKTEIHPVDFDRLSKGMWLETPELVRILRVQPDHKLWRLRVLALRVQITDRTGILVRSEQDRLRLMTDSEAYVWNHNLAMQRESGLMRCAQNTTLIDRSKLNDTERKAADHSARMIGAIAMAARTARKKATLFLRGESVPSLEEGSGEHED